MADRTTTASPLLCARVTGFLYLIIIVCAGFSEMQVRGALIVPGDATATARNILASEGLFRIGFAGDLIAFLCDIAVAATLYVLLKPVNNTLALVSAFFRLAGTAIYGVNLLNQFAALLLLSGAEYLKAFTTDQVHALVMLFLNAHKHGYDLGLVFFGLHCFFLGYLLVKSGYFPRVLGILMILAAFGYLIGSFTLFLFPGSAAAVEPVYFVPAIAELALCLWLLIKGLNVQQWANRVPG